MLGVSPAEIPAVRIITVKRFADSRGFFSEIYSRSAFVSAGIDLDFLQDNQAFSSRRGTLRGLHFQSPPFAQDKLLRVVRGSILDVAVDLRRSSPTFGHHVAIELSATKGTQVFIPIGFAHGYVTLEPDTEIHYKVSNYYLPEHEHGLAWNDPTLGIDWRIDASQLILSTKDRANRSLAELSNYFD